MRAAAAEAQAAGLSGPEELGAGEDGLPNVAMRRAVALAAQIRKRNRGEH